MSDLNRHWMGCSKRVNKLVSKDSDVSKQREFFKKQEAKTKSTKEKQEENERKRENEQQKECEEPPPKKKFDIGISMNMLALCENFEPLNHQ